MRTTNGSQRSQPEAHGITVTNEHVDRPVWMYYDTVGMVNHIDGYWMSVIAPGFFLQRFTLDPLPQGTNVYANISLSFVDTLFAANDPDPKFSVEAFVESWTFYQSDGTESDHKPGRGFN